jgi:hypothetical protein
MGVVTQLLEAVAILVPDFRTFGPSASVFFSLYCCGINLGLPWTKSGDWDLLLCLFLAYGFVVALNIVDFLSSPSRPSATSCRLKSSVERSMLAASPQQFHPNPVCNHRSAKASSELADLNPRCSA